MITAEINQAMGEASVLSYSLCGALHSLHDLQLTAVKLARRESRAVMRGEWLPRYSVRVCANLRLLQVLIYTHCITGNPPNAGIFSVYVCEHTFRDGR